MAQPQVKIDWFQDRVILEAVNALNLEELAFRVEERTKINIVGNGQVDTGFMLGSTFTEAADPERVAVGVGAEYAIYQENVNPFLYPALLEAANEVGGTVKVF